MSTKIGRNEPCLCGSSKKYKRCCGVTSRLASGSTEPQHANAAPSTLVPLGDWMLMEDDGDLDELSNAVVDLLRQGRISDAEAAWEKLNGKYPDMIDPLDRKAMILDAKGEYANAANYYRKAADYARTHEGFDDESVQYFLGEAQRLTNAAS